MLLAVAGGVAGLLVAVGGGTSALLLLILTFSKLALSPDPISVLPSPLVLAFAFSVSSFERESSLAPLPHGSPRGPIPLKLCAVPAAAPYGTTLGICP